MLALHGATICLGAALLFLVQPMVARMLLPLLGGAPAVWNTAMVFYQGVLLLGYGYAHLVTRWAARSSSPRNGHRAQVVLHLALLALAAVVLPLAVPAGSAPPAETSPIAWLLGILTVAVGLPFFALSATSPMLQVWLARSSHPASRDPYFLYAASNLGSVLALLAYPAVVERWLSLAGQNRLWAVGYDLLAILVAASAVPLWRIPCATARGQMPGGAPAAAGLGVREAVGEPDDPAPSPTAGQRARWILLAAVPSSLLLSVTTFLSTDIAAIPLLWVAPLALYLLSFVAVFAPRPPLPHRLVVDALPVVMLPMVLLLAARASEPLALVIPAHLFAFLAVALACHGELAQDRPSPRRLTEFYFWLALGGVIGSASTALVAPLVFRSVIEYPLALVLAVLLPARPAAAWEGRVAKILDLALPLGVGVTALLLVRGVLVSERLPAGGAAALFGGLVLVCAAFVRRPLRLALGLAVVLLAGHFFEGLEGRHLHAERSFFGISRVTEDPTGRYRLLLHGTRLHGMQALDPARRLEPLAYFTRTGPLGELLGALSGTPATGEVAIVGLGAGSLACYGRAGERWTYYEIDPAVVRIATRFFTFLADCPPALSVILGDARLTLGRAPDGRYGVIVLDAYSSDAPPLHLLTLEALRLYLRKLAPRGILAFNVSNRHLDLAPVLGTLARAAGLTSLTRDDVSVTDAERASGKVESRWVVMARRSEDLRILDGRPGWRATSDPPGARPWTDDFASLLDALRWRAAER